MTFDTTNEGCVALLNALQVYLARDDQERIGRYVDLICKRATCLWMYKRGS
jgi:hypothetical protein